MYFEVSATENKQRNIKGLRNWVIKHGISRYGIIEKRRYMRIDRDEIMEEAGGKSRECGLSLCGGSATNETPEKQSGCIIM